MFDSQDYLKIGRQSERGKARWFRSRPSFEPSLARKRYTAEEIIGMLREAEVGRVEARRLVADQAARPCDAILKEAAEANL